MDRDLIDWVNEEVRRGAKEEEVNKTLEEQGYSKKDISEAIEYAMDVNGVTRLPAKRMTVIISSAVAAAILILVLLLSLNYPSIPQSQISEGTNVSLGAGKAVSFNVGQEIHSLKVDSVSENSVTILIHSNPIELNLTVGESKEVDVNGDGKPDLIVKLVSISNRVPKLFIQEIRTKCFENWSCGSWGSCNNSTRMQTRTCTNLNSCGTNLTMPQQRRECSAAVNRAEKTGPEAKNNFLNSTKAEIQNSKNITNKTLNGTSGDISILNRSLDTNSTELGKINQTFDNTTDSTKNITNNFEVNNSLNTIT